MQANGLPLRHNRRCSVFRAQRVYCVNALGQNCCRNFTKVFTEANLYKLRRKALRKFRNIVGVNDGEGPPVPIPNTVVKLTRADNTWLETAR